MKAVQSLTPNTVGDTEIILIFQLKAIYTSKALILKNNAALQ